MREKPPVGETPLLNVMGVRVSLFAEWVYGLVGPVAAQQIAAKLNALANEEAPPK